MKYLTVFLLLALSANAVWAEDPVNFADANLKSAIVEELQKTNPTITDPTPADMLGLTFLSICNRKISNLTGLETAANLDELRVGNNVVIDISPLSGLINLTKLYLYNNRINDIDAISGLSNLTTLNLENNQIGNISALSNLTSLTALYLSGNKINDIHSISNFTELTLLDLAANQISNIQPISGLKKLTSLSLGRNQITDISIISKLTSLKYLYLDEMQIQNISPIANLSDLNRLHLYKNQITDISVISKLTKLTELDLRNNKINDIRNISFADSIKWLLLSDNQISDISSLGEMTKLKWLPLDSNPLDYSAYDICIPMIKTNNPGINLTYDSRPLDCLTIPVKVDIRPGTCPNPLNVDSQGVLSVAILGTKVFNPGMIKIASVRLADVSPVSCSFGDVATPIADDAEVCECTTEGPDGYLDLTLNFKIQEIVPKLGDVNNGDEFELTLTGALDESLDSIPIKGKDCIVIVSKNKTEEK